MRAPELYLASTSPRRRDLLEQAGIPFALIEPGAELDHLAAPAGTTPRDLAQERARRKALGSASRDPHAPVLGVDTVVDVDGAEVGKAADRADAERLLRLLLGRRHLVHTAHCLFVPATGARVEELATAVVTARVPTPDELRRYLDSGDWRGKAGAYGIQDATQSFLQVAEGAFDTVVGLHVAAVVRLLARLRERA